MSTTRDPPHRPTTTRLNLHAQPWAGVPWRGVALALALACGWGIFLVWRSWPAPLPTGHDCSGHLLPAEPGTFMTLAAGASVGGLLVPAGAEVVADTPGALALETRASPQDVRAFYEHHLRARWLATSERPDGLVVTNPRADVRRVSVTTSRGDTRITLRRSGWHKRPLRVADPSGVFGEPVFPGALVAARDEALVRYIVDAPFADVASFYERALRGASGVVLERGDGSPGPPLLQARVSDAASAYVRITVTPDTQAEEPGLVAVVVESAARP